MANVFESCQLPWRIWPWGLDLAHSDTDLTPECSVEFGGMIAQPTLPYRALWVRVEFTLAAFVMAKPHRDDERLSDVTGYDIVAHREPFSYEMWDRKESEWLESGVCPDPSFYFSTDSDWLETVRDQWAARQRTSMTADDAVHFLLDGRDGYLEIAAAGFSWKAWPQGSPLLRNVAGEPVLSGTWTRESRP